MTEVPAVAVDVTPVATRRISDVVKAAEVVNSVPANASAAQQGAIDWNGLIKSVLEAIVSNPHVMSKVFGIPVPAGQEAQVSAAATQAMPQAKRDQVLAYAGMLKWAPPQMVKDRAIGAVRDIVGRLDAMPADEVKARAERLLAQANDHDLAVIKAAIEILGAKT